MMSTQLSQIAKKAKLDRTVRFTSLVHLLTPEFLTETWGMMNRRAASGIDGETHQVRLALALCLVEREVQVDITQHRRYWATLWRTLLGRDECPIDQRTGLKPFSNQLKNCRVGDPMGHHLA